MLHAAAMLAGLFAAWLAFTQHRYDGDAWMAGAGASLLCVALAARLGGLGGGSLFQGARLFLVMVRRTGAAVRGALKVVRAAIAVDVALKPALLRVKARPSGALARASLANLMSAAPGMFAVEATSADILAHVIDEDGVDTAELGQIEADVLSALGGDRGR